MILTGSATGLNRRRTATLTITDDDAAPTAVTLSLEPNCRGRERVGNDAVTVTASLNNSPLPTATTVTVSRTGGTADLGDGLRGGQRLHGDDPCMSRLTGTAQLSFDPSGDSLAEGNETVILTGSATGLTAGTAIAHHYRRRPGDQRHDNPFA